jgi:xanthine dehydrogenase accessory factor
LPRLDDSHLTTCLGPQARLIVIGAGDLSRFLCQMALGLGFEVLVCDPRQEQRASWQLDGVSVSDEMPDDLILRLRPDAHTAVVAVTHDPKLDDLALIDALQSEAFYVGAIGSRRNSALRRERLHMHFDLPESALDALHGPAGLYIGSKTPAEIALSIMAEVVAVKNGVAQPSPVRAAAGKSQYETAGQQALAASSCAA